MDPVSLGGDSGDGSTSDIAKIAGEDQQQEEYHPQPSQPQPQQKKQGRRRLHTSRPYKERLLNMAEARRQIVAALKSHRAAMKGASGQQKRPQKGSQQREATSLERAQDEMIRTKKNPRAHPSNTTSNSPLSLYNNTSLSCPRFSCAYNSTSLVPFPENLSLLFPAGKPLGLNLNYHGFNNMHIVMRGEGTNPPINHSSSSSFSSCHASPTISSRAVTATTSTSVALHKATGAHDQETEGIRSDGDQQKMEGNKKLNSSTSSLWCKILETSTERRPQAPEAGNGGGGTERDVLHMFDEALDMPPYWLEDQHRLDDYYPEECLHDDALTCGSLDIGEIDEMDCGWLS